MASSDELLHTLWTKAVGTPNYTNAEWQRLESRLEEIADLRRKCAALEAQLSQTAILHDQLVAKLCGCEHDGNTVTEPCAMHQEWKDRELAQTKGEVERLKAENAELRAKTFSKENCPDAFDERGELKWTGARSVGHLICQLQTLELSMKVGTVYFVEIDGKKKARATYMSLSRERWGEAGWLDFKSGGPLCLAIWATLDDGKLRELSEHNQRLAAACEAASSALQETAHDTRCAIVGNGCTCGSTERFKPLRAEALKQLRAALRKGIA